MRRLLTIAAVLALLALSVAGAAAATTAEQQAAMAPVMAKADCTYFPETQHNLCAGFLRYWETYGGLAVYGYPLTEEFQEVNPDTGKTYTVQYFERARFEWHPGEWPERWDVMLGRVGYWYAANHDLLGTGAFGRVASCVYAHMDSADTSFMGTGPCWYFDATGHTLSGTFADYWQSHGGLAVFGYPISESFSENGMIVQYFERARFEWHPEFAGTPNEVLLGRLAAIHLMGPTMTTLASGLENPRQMGAYYDSKTGDETIWVAEAGKAGDNCQTTPPDAQGNTSKLCFGTTGAIDEIVNGKVVRTIGGFPSFLTPMGDIAGPSSVSSNTPGVAWVVVGGPGGPNSRAGIVALFGEDIASKFGKLYKVDLNTGTFTAFADLSGYEYAHNPDNGDVSEGDEPTDTNAYSVYDTGKFVLVADAGANDLLKVDYNGNISTVAVFPSMEVPAPPFLGLPPGATIKGDAVPTSVVVGPDGNYYLGMLTAFPFPVGGANVYKVDANTGQVSVYASGFTNIIDLAFDSTGHLYVLEIAENGLLTVGGENGPTPADADASPGALFRVNMDGSKTKIADVGLPFPGGLALGPDTSVYITTYSVFPGMGEVVKVDF